MILQKNITTNYESNAIWKKWMKILQRIKLQHSKYGTEVTNTVSLLFSLKSSKEINTKSLWFIWACHRDETEHGESKNKIFLKRTWWLTKQTGKQTVSSRNESRGLGCKTRSNVKVSFMLMTLTLSSHCPHPFPGRFLHWQGDKALRWQSIRKQASATNKKWEWHSNSKSPSMETLLQWIH